jgi:DNA-binding XRE family transcriptional regulator
VSRLSRRHSLRNGTIGDILALQRARGKVTISAISPEQSRAARGLLDWSRDELATRCGVAKRTIIRFEAGDGETRGSTLANIRAALELAGVIFVEENGEGPGVRLKKERSA